MADEQKRGPYTGEWFDERNKRRKARYREDAEYRTKANKAARDGYRNAVGGPQPPDPYANLALLEAGPLCAGKSRQIHGSNRPRLTFTRAELAVVLNRPVKQVMQWASNNDKRIPSAILKGRVAGVEKFYFDVYTQAEARAIATTLAPYLKELHYFRADHKEAIEAVRYAIALLRKQMTKNNSIPS